MALTKVTGGVVSPTSDYTIRNVTGVAATFTGNVSIGGTLTYEDVTNIDSVGIITARTDIRVGENISHLGDDDTKITFPSAGNQIQFDTGGTNYLKLHNYASVNFIEVGAAADLSFADSGSDTRYMLIGDGSASSTGAITMQAGAGSQGHGGGVTLYSHANTTNAGGVYIGKSLNSDGSIIFGNGGLSPNSEYLRIDENGNVGIGVTNPVQKLSVFGNIYQRQGDLITWNNGDCDVGGISGYHIRFRTYDGSNNLERVRITGGSDAGRVGIGVTNPDSSLHIKSASSPTIHLEDTTQTTKLKVYAQDASAVVGTYSNHPLIFTTNSAAEILRITSTGKVGIGTDNPGSYKTQIETTDQNVLRLVNDSDNADGVELVLQKDSASPADEDNIGNIYFQGNDDSGNPTFYSSIEAYSSDVSNNSEDGYIRFRTRNDGTMGERLRITSEGKTFIERTVSSTSEAHPALEIETICSGSEDTTFATGIDFKVDGVHKKRLSVTDGTGEGGGDWIFYRDHGTNEALRIDKDGRIFIGHTGSLVGGRVELQRAAAETWMTINESSDSGTGPALYINRTRGGNLTSPSPVADGNWLGNVHFGSYDTNSYEIGASISAAADGQTWADGDCPARLMFFTTPDGSATPEERVRITAGGDINIHNRTAASSTDPVTVDFGGQYTPDASITHQNLKVKLFSNSSNNDAGGLTMGQSGVSYVASVGAGHLFYTAPSAVDTLEERLRIAHDGKVGIGTVTPGQTLDVWGNLQVKDVNGKVGLLVDPAAGHFHVNQSVASWTNTDQDPVRILGWGWKSGPGNHMFMASGGNDATATQMALMISEGHGFKVGRSAWDGTDSDVSSTAEYLRITNAGNVGINESSPDSKLHISGGSNENITLKIDPGATAGNYSELVIGRTSSAPTIQTTPAVKAGIPISGVPGILLGSENTNLPCVAIQTPNSSNGHIVFKPKGSEKARFHSGGQLLLGGHSSAIEPGSYESNLEVHGTDTAAGINVLRYSNDAGGPSLIFGKSRGTTIGTIDKVDENDNLGKIQFYGTDTDWEPAAAIQAYADGEWWSGSSGSEDNTDSPGRLEFHTTPNGADDLQERMRINATGQVLIDDAATDGPMETFGSAKFQMATTAGATIVLGRNDTSVSTDNGIGHIYFDVNTASGGAWNECARISVNADGGHSDGDYPSRMQFFTTANDAASPEERLRIDSSGRLKVGDNTRPASDANEGAGLRVTSSLTRNQYYSPAGQYFGSIGYTDDTNTKAWLAVDSAYAQSSAVSAGIFLSAFHQDAGGSGCGFTIKNLKDGNPLVFSSVVTAASTGNPAVESEKFRINTTGYVEFAGASDLRLTLGSTGTAGTNDANWLRASGADLMYNAASGSHKWEIGGSEKLRIDSTGDVKFWGTSHLNNTNKSVNLTAPSYSTSEEDVNLVQVENESGFNQISIGGGTSGLNAATTLRFLTASSVNTTSGTERLRIDANGYVTKPNTPSFYGRGYNGHDGGRWLFDEVSTSTGPHNTGSHFDNNNGKFTCPVAGKYLVSGGYGYLASFDFGSIGYSYNGTVKLTFWEDGRNTSGTGMNSKHVTGSFTVVVECAEDDELAIIFSTGYGAPETSAQYAYGSIYLLG